MHFDLESSYYHVLFLEASNYPASEYPRHSHDGTVAVLFPALRWRTARLLRDGRLAHCQQLIHAVRDLEPRARGLLAHPRARLRPTHHGRRIAGRRRWRLGAGGGVLIHDVALRT